MRGGAKWEILDLERDREGNGVLANRVDMVAIVNRTEREPKGHSIDGWVSYITMERVF